MRKLIIILLVIALHNFNLTYSQIVNYDIKLGTEEVSKSNLLFNWGLFRQAEYQLLESIKLINTLPAIDKKILLEAQIDIQSNKFEQAEEQLKNFAWERKNSPLLPQAFLLRAYCAFKTGKYNKATNLFLQTQPIAEREFINRKDSIYYEIAILSLYWQGISLTKEGKYQDASPVLESLYTKYPQSQLADDALFALGFISELNKAYEVALSYYSTLINRYQFSNYYIIARVREVNIRLLMRDPSTAFLAIENATNVLNRIKSNDSIRKLYESQELIEEAYEELLYLRGEAHNQSKNFNQAINTFNQFIESYPQSKIIDYAYFGKGWALLNIANYDEALKTYDYIIKKGKQENFQIKSLSALYRAITLKQSGNIEQAQQELSALSVQSGYTYTAQALLELGQIYYEKGDYNNAERALERASREATEPTITGRINILLGCTYLEKKLWTKAINEFKSAEQLALKSNYIFLPQKDQILSEARFKLGIALTNSSRYSEAISNLLYFLATNPKDFRVPEAMFWLAEAYYRSDLLKNAIETYKKLINQYPNSQRREESLYGLGWAYFRLENFKESITTFEQLLKEFPKGKFISEVYTRLGDAHYLTKNFRKAGDYYKQASTIAPNTEEGQYSAYQLCHALYRLGDYEQAITSLLNFVKKYPKSNFAPNTIYLTGWIRFQQRRYNEAIDHFNFLIDAYPSSNLVPRAYYAIGDAYFNMSNYEQALKYYKTIIQEFPSNPLAGEALKSTQYCLLALGREEEAFQIADEFVQSNPSSPFAPEFQFKKAELFYTGKKFNDAISEYENFLQKYPDSELSSEALFWLGKSYVQINQIEQAEQTFQRLINKYPQSEYTPVAILEIALIAKSQGNIDKADKLFQKILKEYPDNQIAPQAGYERAFMKFALGDTLEAIDLYSQIADKYPDTEYGDQARYKVAMYHRLKLNYEKARLEFSKIANREANPLIASEAYYRIGELWMRENNYEEALKSFRAVIEYFPGYEDWYSLSLLYLGEIYERLQDYNKALEYYKTLESLRPEDDFGKTAKRRIKELKK